MLLSPTSLAAAMRAACSEADIWLGATTPNPPVGAAALDQTGKILALAAHQRAGSPHAEAALLTLCHERGLLSHIHTICVTLEPCNHYGRTPPCTEALINAGVRYVAIGARDPNRNVQGGGCERLRTAGVEVIENIESDLCQRLIHAYAFYTYTHKPFVTVKRAFDTYGSMIPPAGDKTFTSSDSLTLAHRLRKKADAIVTGSGTILADNPLFTVRDVDDFRGKRRILAILDRRRRITADYIAEAAQRKLDVVIYKDIDTCFADLERRGIRDILVEAGPSLSAAILATPHWVMTVDIHQGMPDRIDVIPNKSVWPPPTLPDFLL